MSKKSSTPKSMGLWVKPSVVEVAIDKQIMIQVMSGVGGGWSLKPDLDTYNNGNTTDSSSPFEYNAFNENPFATE